MTDFLPAQPNFLPPKPTPFLIRLGKWLQPALTRTLHKVSDIDINTESKARVEAIEGFSTIFLPNHSDYADAYVIMGFSREIGRNLYYVTGRELFDEGSPLFRGIRTSLMQHLGGYSILRGAPDRNSFRTTREILSQKNGSLLIFPEGGVSRQTQTVMPFESGVLQLCFWAFDDMRKADNLQPIYAIPMSTVYFYDQDVTIEIEESITKLEDVILSGDQQRELTAIDRLQKLIRTIVSVLEKEHRIEPVEGASLYQRIDDVREHILSQFENLVGVTKSQGDHFRKRIRALKYTVDSQYFLNTDKMTNYQEKRHQSQIQKFIQFYSDINRLFNVAAISEQTLTQTATQENILQVIECLEVEVFGKTQPKGLRTATVRVGEPVNLLDLYETYRANKKGTVIDATKQLENTVQQMVNDTKDFVADRTEQQLSH